MAELPDNLPDVTRRIKERRSKPGTQEDYKSYPHLLHRFRQLLDACEEPQVLKDVLNLDSGYFVPPNLRQQVIEKLLTMERTPQLLRLYAMQLELFGDVDEFGNENLAIDDRVEALHAEADQLDATSPPGV